MPEKTEKRLTHRDGEKMTQEYFRGVVVTKLENLTENNRTQWKAIDKVNSRVNRLGFLGTILGAIAAGILYLLGRRA